MAKFSSISNRSLFLFALLLLPAAFGVHLGLMPFIGDEAIRALVALEMKLSGNYLVPTLNGAAYFNKPPLYNWFLLVAFRLYGAFSEWPSRLTTLFFLGSFALTVYWAVKPHLGRPAAALSALMLVTSGRILFYDSMLGLIDTCFSWVVYLNWMLLYYFGQRGKWTRMFVASYLLAAAAFLLKGLPAAVFQAISLPLALYLHGAWRSQFFSRRHLTGIVAGAAVVLLYYGAYARYQSLETAFAILFEQSLQRTATHHGLGATILHLFTFPFEQLYHFLPWSLLLLPVAHPSFWRRVNGHPFVRFSFWMLAANLTVYWASVEVYPRYLLMFIPLFNLVFLYHFQQLEAENAAISRGISAVYRGLVPLSAAAWWAGPLLHPPVRELPYFMYIWPGIGMLLSLIAAGILADRHRALLWLALALLVVRLGFDLVVLPIRLAESPADRCRASAAELAQKWPGRTWWIWGETQTHQVARFYTTNAVQHIIRRTTQAQGPEALYLVDTKLYPEFAGRAVDTLILEGGEKLPLCQLPADH